MNWLLDTDVLCQPVKTHGHAGVIRWLQQEQEQDSFIAATARKHGLTIATGNDKDFRRPGLKVFNPFKELPPV